MNGVAWGRLLRLSLAPSAAADALAGMTIGSWGAFPLDARAALMPIASLCVFHGGMALNDWADREGDARTRPDRPIPSGAVPARAALWVAVLLLFAGPVLAHFATPAAGLCLGAVAATAACYDVRGRGAWLGPTLLGLCRCGNLAAGVLAGAALGGVALAQVPHWAWLVCGLYGLYVFSASRLARLEDDEDERDLGARPTRALLASAVCLAALPWTVLLDLGPDLGATPVPVNDGFHQAGWVQPLLLAPPVLLGSISAALLASVLSSSGPWTRALVGRAAGMALRRLLVFTAICAWCAPIAALATRAQALPGGALRAWIVAPALLLGYPLALRLRRVFPPT